MFSLTLSAQTFTTLYNFSPGSQHYGASEPVSLLRGPQGELYGTTNGGGRWNHGAVYELLPPASPGGAWSESVLHSFIGGGTGLAPDAGLVAGPNGSLYGLATNLTTGYAVAFQLDPPIAASTGWLYKVIYQFTEDDGYPSGGLVFGVDGSALYGATAPFANSPNDGSVYSLAPPVVAGADWTKMTLYTFSGGSTGGSPAWNLAVGSAGALYGVTGQGGRTSGSCGPGCGTVFLLTPPAVLGGSWTEAVLHAFDTQVGDGWLPNGGVVIGPGGLLYGTDIIGPGDRGSGTAFSLTPPTTPTAPMTESILYAFTNPGAPYGDLVLGPNGMLYGVTLSGGAGGQGTVFELAPPASPGGSWTETILHSFTGGADGGMPDGLVLGRNGILYGTAFSGGTSPYGGTVFALTP
jgi:uncharacterized repeat protein (TIGR03803 family)